MVSCFLIHLGAFVSTEGMFEEGLPSDPFTFLMDASMLGVGVGFDTRAVDSVHNRPIPGPNNSAERELFVIPDSREGWVSSLSLLLDSYFLHLPPISFDYSQIRKAGEIIKGFGGVCSGPAPLKEMHERIESIMVGQIGKCVSISTIVDIMNIIGKCVVSGNVRRTAEIAFGSPDSQEYIDLKNYDKNPHRRDFGWTSNNSVFSRIGQRYGKELCERVLANGEPGFFWLENAQKYGRMCDPPVNNK